jgi:hypothetical protein
VTRPDDLEPLDDVLVDLIAAEQRRPAPPPGTAERVRAAVLVTVATGVASSAAAAHGASAAGSAVAGNAAAGTGAATAVGGGLLGPGLVVVAALAATVGGTLFVASYEPTTTTAPIVATAPAAPIAPPTTTPAATSSAPALPAASAPPVLTPAPATKTARPAMPPSTTPPAIATPTPTTPSTPEARAAALAAERGLLAEARRALQADDVATALARVAEHRARHPDGVLVEEREALMVMARARRGDNVDDAIADFRARYPRSLFLEAIGRSARDR